MVYEHHLYLDYGLVSSNLCLIYILHKFTININMFVRFYEELKIKITLKNKSNIYNVLVKLI